MIMLPGPNGIPIIIPTGNSTPQEEPKCPHCHKELEGWSEPSEPNSLLTNVVGSLIVILLLANIVACIGGSVDGSFSYGDREMRHFGEKRYDYIVPAYWSSFLAIRWLTNKPIVFEKGE